MGAVDLSQGDPAQKQILRIATVVIIAMLGFIALATATMLSMLRGRHKPGLLRSIFAFGGLAATLYVAHVALPVYVDTKLNTIMPWIELDQPSAEAIALHSSLFVVDMHSDSLMWARRDILKRNEHQGHVDVPRLQEGNVALQAFTIVTGSPKGLNFENNYAPTIANDSITLKALMEGWGYDAITTRAGRTLYQAERLRNFVDASNGELSLITSVEQLDNFVEMRKKNPRLVSSILGIEGLHALDGKLENVKIFVDAGIHMMALTHFFDNKLGGSAAGVAKNGLTPFGKKVIREMEKHHVLIDVAHASHQLISDILDVATTPVMSSHTGVSAVCPNSRNIKDDAIRRMAASGGVVSIAYFRPAICGGEGKEPGDDLASIVASIQHVANLVGVDHVGLGSDFDGTVSTPFDTTGVIHITDRLLDAGFSHEDIAKIMGGNLLRLLRAVLPEK